MKLKSLSTAIVALSIVTSSTMAAAAPVATPLTQPASERVSGENELRGSGVFVLLIALVAIGLGIAAAAGGNDKPNSP